MTAEEFVLKKIKPRSGSLKTGVMNNDYAAELIDEYSRIRLKEFFEFLEFRNYTNCDPTKMDHLIGEFLISQ